MYMYLILHLHLDVDPSLAPCVRPRLNEAPKGAAHQRFGSPTTDETQRHR